MKYKKSLIILLMITPFLCYACSAEKWSGSSKTSPESFSWKEASWSECQNGNQTRTVTCVTQNNSVAGDSFCTGTKPISSQTCYYTYSWSGVWSACSNKSQTRKVICKRSDGTTFEDSFCSGTKPAESQSCSFALNDTGMTKFKNSSSNNLTTAPTNTYPGQDGTYGRDAEYNDISDGNAGFSFTKLGANGQALEIQNVVWNKAGTETNGSKWSCVLDNLTGLVWELKTEDGGLQSASNTYSWYSVDSLSNGGNNGEANKGVCVGGISCDTKSYIERINADKLCGYSNWRLPKYEELLTIVDYSIISPSIDKKFFPTMLGTSYWTNTSFLPDTNKAWVLDFYSGLNYDIYKNTANYLILVAK